MGEKNKGPEPVGLATVEIDKDYLLSETVNELLSDAKNKGLQIDKSKGAGQQTIDSLMSSVDSLRKTIKEKKLTGDVVKSFFDNYLPSAINNPSAECVEFRLKLAKALSVEIKNRLG